MQREISHKEAFRWYMVEQSACFLGPVLVQEALKPYIRVQQVHGSISSPFKGFLGELQGRVLAVISQGPSPTLPQHPPILPCPPLQKEFDETPDSPVQAGWKLLT